MKHMLSNGAFCVVVLLALTGCNLVTYEQEKTYTLDANGLDTLSINHDVGDVTITGVEGLEEIVVHATFSAVGEEIDRARQFSEENMGIELTSENSTGLLTTSVKQGTKQEQGYLHLAIEAPSRLKMNFRHSEGQLQISSMNAGVQLQHGVGHLTLEDIRGDVQLTDGAGNVTLTNVIGDTTIHSNAGRTSVTQSVGAVSITAGSGDVEVADYQGDVTIRSGTGNLNIQSILGDVKILENRSGTITITDITGNVTQP